MAVRLAGASICIQLCVWCLLVGRNRKRVQERYIVVSQYLGTSTTTTAKTASNTTANAHIEREDKSRGEDYEEEEVRNMIARR